MTLPTGRSSASEDSTSRYIPSQGMDKLTAMVVHSPEECDGQIPYLYFTRPKRAAE